MQSLVSIIKNLLPKEKKERQLALHISGVSFLVFMIILWGIILWSYIYQMDRLKRDFLMETRIFETDQNTPRIQEMMKNMIGGNDQNIDPRRRWGGPKWPRDIIVIDDNNIVIKNDIFELDDEDIKKISFTEMGHIDKQEIDEKSYLTYKIQSWSYSIIFFRDLSAMRDFHIRLAILALIASNVAFLIIYFLAGHLARITIEPIREHNEALESYNHNVAHELKTPLAIMRSNLELLKLKPEQKFIDSTTEEVISMEKIIETLLFLAKPTTGKDTEEIIDLSKSTQSMIDEYNNSDIILQAPKKKIQIRGNTELFKRILMNLIDNALKYKSKWAVHITLQSEWITISNQIEENIPREELEKLTQMFYQWDQSRHTSGQWLGLALVKKIVEISGWKLVLESRENIFSAKIEF